MATMAADAVGSSLQRDDDLGQTARTLVETTPAVTNQKFSMWFRLLGASDRYPGSFGLMYIENVRQAQLAGFSRQVLADPPLGLPVTEPFTVSPQKSNPPYCLTRAVAVQVAANSGVSLTSLAGLFAFTAPDLDYCAMAYRRRVAVLVRAAVKTAAVTLASLIAESPHEVGVPTIPAVLPGFLAKSGLFVTMTPIYPGGRRPRRHSAPRLGDGLDHGHISSGQHSRPDHPGAPRRVSDLVLRRAVRGPRRPGKCRGACQERPGSQFPAVDRRQLDRGAFGCASSLGPPRYGPGIGNPLWAASSCRCCSTS